MPDSEPTTTTGTSQRYWSILATFAVIPPVAMVLVGLFTAFWPPAFVLFALIPALPIALGLKFLRPIGIAPGDPIKDSGTLFGHPWVLVAAQHYWLEKEAAAAARENFEEPYFTVSPSGFKLSVRPANAPNFSGWLMGRLLWWGSIGISTPIFLAVLLSSALDASPIQDILLAIPVTFICSLVGYAAVLGPWWVIVALLDGGLFPEVHEVELHGRTLRVGAKTFTLGHPEQTAVLKWTRQGTQLMLHNPTETLVITGAHNAVAWLARQIQALPELGDAQEVPEALRSLRQPGVAKD